ncbi:hypothetical protein BDB00DRAFT_398442 [Zychaea mexicana]|uniref:uncharacterized protein n=1 Tax=Zychaea mexicana TaxID=64656 RepID=UPI0022FEE3FF|nr:uncharacterized protein BDB00DRAFT_398442 [Zychaea mexicana]KAI9498708.1 hypothetical protein BDB00DRAFT_398442 [Zychaea mexicana]
MFCVGSSTFCLLFSGTGYSKSCSCESTPRRPATFPSCLICPLLVRHNPSALSWATIPPIMVVVNEGYSVID